MDNVGANEEQQEPARPTAFDEVRERMRRAKAGEEVEDNDDGPELSDPDDAEAAADEVQSGAWPDWVMIPDGMVFPEGKVAFAVRFRAGVTDQPKLGERQCILWNLTEADEKLALKRTRGEHLRTIDELAKQMIRVIDGKKVTWTANVAHNPNFFWNAIGGACRTQLKNLYVKRHSLSTEDSVDFFTNCVAARTVGT